MLWINVTWLILSLFIKCVVKYCVYCILINVRKFYILTKDQAKAFVFLTKTLSSSDKGEKSGIWVRVLATEKIKW